MQRTIGGEPTDISVINQTIYDYKKSTTFGKVTFTPILSDLNSAAPDIEVFVILVSVDRNFTQKDSKNK